ncbi:hypothetical protein A9978_18880 [Pseudomonas sp. UMC65]|uniref:hypothetical protein n=1 Tax=Pseudomonas sp. UMC65 TaxID=1862323 RepID=UPI0016034AD5|nr:hypothetical protein [Pseudomonas sp. UMC65]MBB1614505.1 hypothetical protein [Pseudomonas sp. UMC65]
MADYTELKRLLDGCKESNCADAEDFGRRISDLYDYLDPETVAEMVAEIESLRGPHDWLAEDLIKELVDNARAFQGNSDHGEDDPFAIALLAAASRIRRQEVNIDQLKAENGSLRGSTKRMGEDVSKMQKQLRKAGRDIEKLKKENDRLECLLEIKKIDAKTYREASERFQGENEELKEDVRIGDKIIAERDRLLSLFECPVHGKCVPYAMEQVVALRKSLADLLDLYDTDEGCRSLPQYIAGRAALSKGEQP